MPSNPLKCLDSVEDISGSVTYLHCIQKKKKKKKKTKNEKRKSFEGKGKGDQPKHNNQVIEDFCFLLKQKYPLFDVKDSFTKPNLEDLVVAFLIVTQMRWVLLSDSPMIGVRWCHLVSPQLD